MLSQIKNRKVLTFSCNEEGKMLMSENHEIINDAKDLYSTFPVSNGVFTWGDQDFGGNSIAVKDQLNNIKMISSTDYAFAALKNDGSVVTWGSQYWDGDSSAVQNKLKNMKMIYSTAFAFGAL